MVLVTLATDEAQRREGRGADGDKQKRRDEVAK